MVCHVAKRGEKDLAKPIQGLRVEVKQGNGRPKLTWKQVIHEDMIGFGIAQDKRA